MPWRLQGRSAFREGGLWVLDEQHGQVQRRDPSTGSFRPGIRVDTSGSGFSFRSSLLQCTMPWNYWAVTASTPLSFHSIPTSDSRQLWEWGFLWGLGAGRDERPAVRQVAPSGSCGSSFLLSPRDVSCVRICLQSPETMQRNLLKKNMAGFHPRLFRSDCISHGISASSDLARAGRPAATALARSSEGHLACFRSVGRVLRPVSCLACTGSFVLRLGRRILCSCKVLRAGNDAILGTCGPC